jgi:hypothetical protein
MASWIRDVRTGLLKQGVIDYLLRAEPGLRRHRDRLLLAVVAMMAAIATADMRISPGISLAFGYSLPVAVAAYALGIRVGVLVSVVAVVLRAVFAGRAYGPWWLYGGSALMLAEYVLLALAVGLLGRAVARLDRHTRVLRHVNELGRHLATARDPDAIWRAGVEGAVRLTGADGGFLATQHGTRWRANETFHRGQWRERSVILLTQGGVADDAADLEDHDGSWHRDAPIRVAAPVTVPAGGPPRQLVVFRAASGPFTPATADVLKLAALHLTTALHLTAGTTPPASVDSPRETRGAR